MGINLHLRTRYYHDCCIVVTSCINGHTSEETFYYYVEIDLSTLFSQTTEVCVIPCIQLLHFGTLRKT